MAWFSGITWLCAPYFPVLGTAAGHVDIFRFKQTAIATYLGWQETGVTVPVGAYQGGTGLTSIAANAVLLGNGTGALQAATVGTSGNVLTDNGSGSIPTFQGPVTSNYTSAGLVTSYTPTTTWGTTGLSITLPGAGVYFIAGASLLFVDISGTIQQQCQLNVQMYDVTISAYVNGTRSSYIGMLQTTVPSGTPFRAWSQVPIGPAIYSVTGSRVLQLWAALTNVTATITNPTVFNANTAVSAFRIG